MLVFDSAYTYEIMVARNIAALVTGRDLGGYFEHIWTVHPVASLLKPEGSSERFGQPRVHPLAPGHTVIEGSIGVSPRLSWFPPLNFLLAQAQLLHMLLRLVRAERIQIVRAEDPLYNGLLGYLLARWCKLPLMIGVWGNPGEIRRRTGDPIMARLFKHVAIEEWVERFVLRRADLGMAQNEDNRKFLVAQGLGREKTAIFRLGNVLHADHFVDPAARASGEPDLVELGVSGLPCILTISRLQELKLVDHVILAVRTLKDRGIRVAALFVGDGPFRPGMEALAAELGISEQVVFCGNREQPWLARVIPTVAVVASPLTGRALAEAALGGARVVAYDVDWHSELVHSGKTGELVPYLDHVAMADGIERLLVDPERAHRIGCNLRERALEMLDPTAADEAQIHAYESLLRPQANRPQKPSGLSKDRQSMRILHILPEFAKGGGERVAIDLANHATARGHEVSMLASAAVDPAWMPAPLDRRVKIRFVNAARRSRLWKYAAILAWLLRNRQWLLDQDVVHCHMSFGAVTGTAIQLLQLFFRSPTPIVVETYHAVGMPMPPMHRALHDWMARRRHAVALMATDPFWNRFMEKHPLCRLIPNGIQFTGAARSGEEVRAYREQQALIPPTAELVVGTVGRIAPERRPEQFIPIFAAVQRALGPKVHLLLAGAGPELKKVQALVREHGLERQVHLPGLALDPVLAMKAMDLYITLTIGPVPGVAAIEAAFCGVPVIAIQMVPGYKAQADDWIWSSGDTSTVAREAIRLLSNPEARARLAERQTAFVRANHTVEVMANSYYDLYEIAFNRRQSSAAEITARKGY